MRRSTSVSALQQNIAGAQKSRSSRHCLRRRSVMGTHAGYAGNTVSAHLCFVIFIYLMRCGVSVPRMRKKLESAHGEASQRSFLSLIHPNRKKFKISAAQRRHIFVFNYIIIYYF